jgi:hypothetical protein
VCSAIDPTGQHGSLAKLPLAASSSSSRMPLPALMLLLLAVTLAASFSGAGAQPSPGYFPSARYRPLESFNRGYVNKWGPQHQTLSGDHSSLTIWLDKTCGKYVPFLEFINQLRAECKLMKYGPVVVNEFVATVRPRGSHVDVFRPCVSSPLAADS